MGNLLNKLVVDRLSCQHAGPIADVQGEIADPKGSSRVRYSANVKTNTLQQAGDGGPHNELPSNRHRAGTRLVPAAVNAIASAHSS